MCTVSVTFDVNSAVYMLRVLCCSPPPRPFVFCVALRLHHVTSVGFGVHLILWQLTTWNPTPANATNIPGGPVDYASKHWSGLISDYYSVRASLVLQQAQADALANQVYTCWLPACLLAVCCLQRGRFVGGVDANVDACALTGCVVVCRVSTL